MKLLNSVIRLQAFESTGKISPRCQRCWGTRMLHTVATFSSTTIEDSTWWTCLQSMRKKTTSHTQRVVSTRPGSRWQRLNNVTAKHNHHHRNRNHLQHNRNLLHHSRFLWLQNLRVRDFNWFWQIHFLKAEESPVSGYNRYTGGRMKYTGVL